MKTATPGELLPCPFCGGVAKFSIDPPNDECWVACENDHCDVAPAVAGKSPKDAYNGWNRRAVPSETSLTPQAAGMDVRTPERERPDQPRGELAGVSVSSDKQRKELADSISRFPTGWVPTGPCVNMTVTPEERDLIVAALREALSATLAIVPPVPADWKVGVQFRAYKERPGHEHEPWYVACPNGALLRLGFHNEDAEDQRQAEWIAAACNAARPLQVILKDEPQYVGEKP